jgi:hypothetical protein
MASKMGTGWPRREPPTVKQAKAKVEAALAAHDRIQAESDAIRQRHGLPPVPENTIVRAWRAKLATAKLKAAKREPAAKVEPSSPLELVADLAERRAKLKREGEQLDRELRELVASRAVPVSRLALALGISRQRVYQLA